MHRIRTSIGVVIAVGLLAGSARVVAQEDLIDPSAAAWVTGSVVFASGCEDPTVSTVDGVLQQRG